MRYRADIYALRIGNVIEPHEYGMFTGFLADRRCRASATPGATSTPATSARSSICVSKGRARLPGVQCDQRHITLNTPTREFSPGAVRTRRSPARWASSGAAVEPQGARGARIQGSAQLAEIRRLGRARLSVEQRATKSRRRFFAKSALQIEGDRAFRNSAIRRTLYVPRGLARVVGAAAAGFSGQRWRG